MPAPLGNELSAVFPVQKVELHRTCVRVLDKSSVQCKTHLIVGFRVIANALIDLRTSSTLPRCSRVSGKREVIPRGGLPTTTQASPVAADDQFSIRHGETEERESRQFPCSPNPAHVPGLLGPSTSAIAVSADDHCGPMCPIPNRPKCSCCLSSLRASSRRTLGLITQAA